MTRIGLLSDTHGSLNPRIFDFFAGCDEIWHAGDIGNLSTAAKLAAFKLLRAVHGNIDGTEIRSVYPRYQIFRCEEVKVVMTHIGGYPGRYEKDSKAIIEKEKPGIFISGHSHILKLIFDKQHQLLHINPGAAGNSGMHQVITCVRFLVDQKDIRELDIFELSRKTKDLGY
jgi:putative phosphoesterase